MKKIIISFLSVLLILNSIFITGIYAEEQGVSDSESSTALSEEIDLPEQNETGKDDVVDIQEDDSEIQSVEDRIEIIEGVQSSEDPISALTNDIATITSDDDQNGVEYKEISYSDYVPDIVRPVSFAFYVEDEIKNEDANVLFSYTAYNCSEIGFDVKIEKSVFHQIETGEVTGRIILNFSNNESKEFNISDCFDYCDGNLFTPEGESYSIRLWAVAQTLLSDMSITFNDGNKSGTLDMRSLVEDGMVCWQIKPNEFKQDLYDAYFNTVLNNYDNTDLVINYTLNGISVTKNKEDIRYGNYQFRHGHYYECDNGSGEIEYITIGYYWDAVPISDIESAFYVDEEEDLRIPFTFISDQSDEYTRRYTLQTEEGFDYSLLKEGYYLELNSTDGTQVYAKWFIHEYGGQSVLENEIYFTQDDNSDVRFIFSSKGAQNDSYKNSSFIDVAADYDYECFLRDDRYEWYFYVDPEVLYNGEDYFMNVDFRNNFDGSAPFDRIEFQQLRDDEYSYLVPKEEVDLGEEKGVRLTFKGRTDQLFKITAYNGDSEVESQRHIFRVVSRDEDLFGHLLVSRFDRSSNNEMHGYWFQNVRDLDNGVFRNATLFLEVDGNPSSIVKTIENLNDSDHSNENFESDYFTVYFKEGVTITSKKYDIYMDDSRKMPLITYQLSDGEVEETLTVMLRIYEMNITDQVLIDGHNYQKNEIYRDGSLYTIYLHNNNTFTVTDILDFTKGRYHTLVVNNDRHIGVSSDPITYDDGLFFRIDRIDYLEMYYPADGYEITNGSSLSDEGMIRISNLEPFTIQNTNSYGGSSLSQVTRWLHMNKRIPIGYYDIDGQLKYIENRFNDYDEFSEYNGDEPGYFEGIERMPNGTYGINKLIKTNKPVTIVWYNTVGSSKSVDPNKSNFVKQLTVSEEQSAADVLEETIVELADYTNSTIELSQNISLDRDVLMKYFWMMNQERDSYLTIDLKGHSINTNEFKLELPDNCGIRFTNSSSEPGKIYGNGETVLKCYGYMKIDNNVTIENDNGIGVTIANDSDGVILGNSSMIDAKIGIMWIERKSGIFAQKNGVGPEINGTILADQYGIYANLPSDPQGLSYRILLQRNEGNGAASINSSDVGIYINGSVTFNSWNANIVAGQPFVVNGGNINLNDIDVTATDGDIVLVDSASANASSVKISFNMEGPAAYVDCIATGSIVSDTVSSGSKIKKVALTSTFDANTYFDYQGSLFSNVPSDAVEINGGYFIKNDFEQYVPSGQLAPTGTYDPNLYTIEQVNRGSKIFYRLVKPLNNTYVSNLDDLRQALESEQTGIIYVASDFDGNNEEISFKVDGTKFLDLQGHTIKNIKLYAWVEELDENNGNEGEFKIKNGTIRNDSGMNVLSVNGVKLRMFDGVSIISNDGFAIELYNGALDLRDSCIKGRGAILVNIDTNKEGFFGRVYVDNSELVGLNSAAILVDSTYEKENDNHPTFDVWDSKISVVNENGQTGSESAIRIRDDASFSFFHSEINAGDYGIKFLSYDSASEDRVWLFDSVINGRVGVLLNQCASMTIKNDSYITADTNAIELYDLSALNIQSAYIFGGQADIHYLDDGSLRKQNIMGGHFSKFVTERSLPNYNENEYRFVCKMTQDENATYPYEVVKKYTDVNVYQNISLSIPRKIKIDQSLLEQSISESEREYYGNNNTVDVDVILTVTPETDQQKKNVFINAEKTAEFTDFYDIYINKNIGANKQRAEEVSGYQVISISLSDVEDEYGNKISFEDVNKVNIYHQHGSEPVMAMKKVSEDDGRRLQEECFFLSRENGEYYVNIVTRRFSTFALASENKEIENETLKQKVELDLSEIYKESYEVGETISMPTAYDVEGIELELGKDIKVVYEGIGDTKYYSEIEYPICVGTYRATWIISEEVKTLSGQGSAEFEIKDKSIPTITLSSVSLYLEGKVGVNFKFDIPDELYNDDTLLVFTHHKVDEHGNLIDVTDGSNVYTFKATDAATDKSGHRVFTIYRHVMELGDDISVKIIDTGNNPVRTIRGSDSLDITEGYDYNVVASYISYFRQHPEKAPANLLDFMNDLDNYSNAARINFKYNKDSAIIDYDLLEGINAQSVEDYAAVKQGTLPEGITHSAASLLLEEATTINHKFTLSKGEDISDFIFKVEGKQVTPVYRDNRYVIEIGNIYAYDLDRFYTLEVSKKGSDKVYSVSYSALTYMRTAYSYYSDNKPLLDMLNAMYKYNLSANTYFNN